MTDSASIVAKLWNYCNVLRDDGVRYGYYFEQLRQSILKKAFKGKLVPQEPNDEPASELLKRIKLEKVNAK